jgi:hypothetical protein
MTTVKELIEELQRFSPDARLENDEGGRLDLGLGFISPSTKCPISGADEYFKEKLAAAQTESDEFWKARERIKEQLKEVGEWLAQQCDTSGLVVKSKEIETFLENL